MSPAIAAPVPKPQGVFDPVHKAGFFLLCVYLFITYSRVLDVTVARLHIPMMLSILLYGLTAFAGGLQSSFATVPGKLLVGITACMILGIPFSVWPGGVLNNLMSSWLRVVPLFFIIVGLVLTTEECIRLIRRLSWAILTMVFIALIQGNTQLGRLVIDNSRFADPNDLALMCLIGISLWCVTFSLSRTIGMKIIAFGAAGIVLYAIVRTGSRGALLGLIAMLGFAFLKSSMMGKLKMTLAVLVLIPLTTVIVPRQTLLRWLMVFDSSVVEENRDELRGATASTEARWQLFLDSLILTARYPVFGVGLGNFAVADNDIAVERGFVRGSWHVGHNMYTQASSECGVPAFFMFAGVLVYVFRRVVFIRKKLAPAHPRAEELSTMALWLQMGLIGFCVTGFFLNVAFTDTFPLLSGIVVVLERAIRTEIALGAVAVVAQPVPVIVAPRQRVLLPVHPL